MSEGLISVGLDVGTTTTQLIVSRLTVENRAGAFSVPELEIADREILYESRIHFTPLLDERRVDAAALRRIVEAEYRRAGIDRNSVDTGAIIITGETSRKENARAVLEALADYAGDFVVATAGPDLESVLAARGAGAVAWSAKTGEAVVHMDIGGGTSNLALIREGRILRTTCLNVGGRLIKYDEKKTITYVSPVLQGLCALRPGDLVTPKDLEKIAALLAQALEMAVGFRPPTELLSRLTTEECRFVWEIPAENVGITLSGGVADCVDSEQPWDAFGDLGPALGRALRESALCRRRAPSEGQTIRATVIGAGCHSAQLSGSTVFHRNIRFPLKNLPVACPEALTRTEIRRALDAWEGAAVLAIPGIPEAGYRQIVSLAEELLAGTEGEQLLICLEQDMAKALGQALALRMGKNGRILCIDRVKAGEGSYLDIGAPIGPAMPVVVKTLVLGKETL